MRKIIVSNLVSLDGYMAGQDGDIDWFVNITDKEFDDYAVSLMNSVDIMLFGRITYQLIESYWPAAAGDKEDLRIINAMNNFPKVVFSKTLEKVNWKNSKLVKDDLIEEVLKLKQQPGKDMVIYGSGSIVSALPQKNLIDDYRIIVCPVILGKGKLLFNDINEKMNLSLIDLRTFNSGWFLFTTKHFKAVSLVDKYHQAFLSIVLSS